MQQLSSPVLNRDTRKQLEHFFLFGLQNLNFLINQVPKLIELQIDLLKHFILIQLLLNNPLQIIRSIDLKNTFFVLVQQINQPSLRVLNLSIQIVLFIDNIAIKSRYKVVQVTFTQTDQVETCLVSLKLFKGLFISVTRLL